MSCNNDSNWNTKWGKNIALIASDDPWFGKSVIHEEHHTDYPKDYANFKSPNAHMVLKTQPELGVELFDGKTLHNYYDIIIVILIIILVLQFLYLFDY